ncbi:acyltransferase family protein [Altererythrobacter indicus]|uniref:Acyltransferase family protein n=2 Tax=Altericroceibacterium indicum TaxID=374177 RepID=A0A845AIN7_9SPHN|nr:acyltransferase family protein [Altericroceibacterium indicum]
MSEYVRIDPARRSEAISMARVICIMGIVYVHAWTGLTGPEFEALRGSAQDIMRWVMMDVFGRSAVPLLGLVSGWLVAGSSRVRNWGSHVARKARTILLPMVLWNVLALILICGSGKLFNLQVPWPPSLSWVFQEVFILTRPPDMNVQMPFLRDLFLCMVLAPMLVRWPGWALACVLALTGVCHIFDLGAPIILRVSILFFFTLGILVRRSNLADRITQWPLILAALPFLIVMPIQLCLTLTRDWDMATPEARELDLAVRIAAALAYWRVAWALTFSPLRQTFLKIEPYMFFYFCAHLILMWLGGPLLGKVFGKLGSPLYPIYFLTQPFMVLAVIMPIGMALTRYWPSAADLLSGGRLTGEPRRKTIPAWPEGA